MCQPIHAKSAFSTCIVLALLLVCSDCFGQNRSRQSNASQGSQKADEIKVRLPENADTVVLTMDTYGGFRMKTADGFEPTPLLKIFADGRVVAGRKSENVKEVKGSIDLVELQALLSYAVDECHFFKISTESVKADLAKRGALKIMDAGTTKVAINLKDHSNEVEVYALQAYAGQFADIPSFASMVAVASRCRQLASEIKLGSEEEAEAALTSANRSLARKNKAAPPFTMKNLQFAEQFVNGKRSATFVQNYEEGDKRFLAFATFEVDENGKESTTAEVHEQASRN